MIFGECPHCDGFVINPIGPAPCWSKNTCEHCGKEYWLKHSRLDPEAFTEKPEEVDETRIIPKEGACGEPK